jgi:hypothetical protein
MKCSLVYALSLSLINHKVHISSKVRKVLHRRKTQAFSGYGLSLILKVLFLKLDTSANTTSAEVPLGITFAGQAGANSKTQKQKQITKN